MGKPKYIEPVRTRLRQGDVVEIISGKERGKRGPIISIDRQRGRVLVEGVNFVYRHQRPTSQAQQGGIIQREAYLHISNVMAIDPDTDKPTRIGIQRDKKGVRIRIAKKSGKALDKQ